MTDTYPADSTSASACIITPDMHRYMPNIGVQLRTIRQQVGLRQEDLAAQINVSQATISHIERGGATGSDVVERWAAACGAQIAISRGYEAELEAAVFALDDGDKARLLRIARVLPLVQDLAKDRATTRN